MIAVLLALASCVRAPKPRAPQPALPAATQPAAVTPALAPMGLVPLPATVEPRATPPFQIGAATAIAVSTPDAQALRIAGQLAHVIGRSPGPPPKCARAADPAAAPAIVLALGPVESAESYDLTIAEDGVRLTAPDAAGLFYGVQTLRQLLPSWGEYEALMFQQPRPATLPAVHIRDAPRYPWRGAMLDVARHFFTVDEVKRYVDLLALHKMNRLHLHLADH